jgi:uncharacterized protein YukE
MANEFEISPASLETAAQGLQQSGEDFASAVEKLKARVLGAGSPWGNDETGTMFGSVYTECTEVGMQALDHTAELLGSIATSLQQMAQNVQSHDQGAAAGFDKIL